MNMFRKQKREQKEADMDPGLDKMMELEKMTRLKARLPTPEAVAKAFTDFFMSKLANQQDVEDVQAKLALQSLKYCLAAEERTGSDRLLQDETLSAAARALTPKNQKITKDHVRLGEALHKRLQHADRKHDEIASRTYVKLLAFSREPTSAQATVLGFEKRHPLLGTAVDDLPKRASLWASIINATMGNQDEVDLKAIFESIRERGLSNFPVVQLAMLRHAISTKDAVQIERCWEAVDRTQRENPASISVMYKTLNMSIRRTLEWCLSTDNLELGHRIVATLLRNNPKKPVWDMVFLWAAGTGKGVDEIGRMIDVMEKTNSRSSKDGQLRPDINTINGLVEFATNKNDPYMAERFIALGQDRGIQPDAKTYALQMDYRLRVKDLDGALIAYKNLQTMDLSSDNDVPTVNALLVALCDSTRHDFDTIMNIAADLSDRRARFEPQTVAKLSLLHLNRDELHDVIDLLNTHAFHYSSAERGVVRDALLAYCLDDSTPVSRAWDAYSILRDIFDELSRGPRTELMTSFFARDRPDMAVHVFNHMRSHSRLDTMPIIDTYVTAFMGAAKRKDLESLEVLHNQLKLDFNINLNTPLRNALMIAYTACGRPRKALGFWDEVVASREGPNYNSIHVALRACERAPFGDVKAKEIWTRLRKMSIELDSTLWASFASALAGNGEAAEAMRVLDEGVKKSEVGVDAFVLGSVFGSATGMVKQGEVETWGKKKYAAEWKELETKHGPSHEEEDGRRWFEGVDRSVTP